MGRLTYYHPDGTWGVEGIDLAKLPTKLYACLAKLKDYENSGKTPDECQAFAAENSFKMSPVARDAENLRWTEHDDFNTARYRGWLLVHLLWEDTIQLYCPEDAWDDPDVLNDLEEIQSYGAEWEADDVYRAIEWIDNY